MPLNVNFTKAFQNKIGKSLKMVLLIVYSKCTLDMVLSNEPEHNLLSFAKMDEKTTKKSKKTNENLHPA